ncbi:MAG: polysaccharide pyruvyl transferase family protein [Bdellovibrionales bacterium]|nr:polysaccharide pyruvyl transferase family protein [Bdellovibrionales bacterium]
MKGSHPRITLLGNNSGRNLGDAAILSSILEDLTKHLPDAEFYCPSVKPKWVEQHYGKQYNVKSIDVMPWTGSIRLLGIPTFRAMAKSDAALICDGIIFGIKLFNPAFNYLITLIFLMPWAKFCGCKMVCYNTGIGPFPGFFSKLFAKWVVGGCDLVLMREKDSIALARAVGVTGPIELTGDSAFINPVSGDDRAVAIAAKLGIDLAKPMLGVNVTSYIDTWLDKDSRVSERERFVDTIAKGLNQAKAATNNEFQVVVFSTHPMDEAVCEELARKTNGKVVNNSDYLSHDIQAVMRRCELFVGMRFHSLILASAVGAPILGLNYAPKVRSYLRLLECSDYCLELAEVTPERLAQTVTRGWENRAALKQAQQPIIETLKRGAARAAEIFCDRYYPSRRKSQAHSEYANGASAERRVAKG